MPDPVLIGQAVAAAAALAAAAVLLFGWPWRAPSAARLTIGGALGVGMGVVAGAWVLGLAPRVPPREDLDRLLLILIPAAAGAEVLAALVGRAGWLARVVVAAGAAPVLLYGSSYVTDLSGPGSREWAPLQTWLIFAGLAVALAAVWGLLARLEQTAGRSVVWAVALASAGAAVVVMLSGYASGGQLGFPIAAAVAGAAIGSLVPAGKPAADGALGVGVVGLFALLVVGHLFAGLTAVNGILLFAAPLLGWVPECPPADRLGARVRGALRLALAAVPVVVALLLAQEKFAADSGRTAPEASEPSLQDYLDFGK